MCLVVLTMGRRNHAMSLGLRSATIFFSGTMASLAVKCLRSMGSPTTSSSSRCCRICDRMSVKVDSSSDSRAWEGWGANEGDRAQGSVRAHRSRTCTTRLY